MGIEAREISWTVNERWRHGDFKKMPLFQKLCMKWKEMKDRNQEIKGFTIFERFKDDGNLNIRNYREGRHLIVPGAKGDRKSGPWKRYLFSEIKRKPGNGISQCVAVGGEVYTKWSQHFLRRASSSSVSLPLILSPFHLFSVPQPECYF